MAKIALVTENYQLKITKREEKHWIYEREKVVTPKIGKFWKPLPLYNRIVLLYEKKKRSSCIFSSLYFKFN